MPRSLFRYVLRDNGAHQLLLSLLTIVSILIELAPLELQRRIVNDLIKNREYRTVALLCAVYAGVVLVQGGTKLGVNMYRGWIGERAILKLRRLIRRLGEVLPASATPENSGIKVSMIVAEVEPIGGFVGGILADPLTHGGILASTFAYLAHLDLRMALAAAAIFVPQFIFVPLLQGAINRRAAHRIRLLRRVSAGIIGTEGRRVGGANELRIKLVFRLDMAVFWFKYVMNFLMNLGNHLQIVAALLFGGWLVLQGELEIGGVVAFISGIAKVKDPWDDLIDYFRNMAVAVVKYRLVADAVNQLANEEPQGLRLTAAHLADD